MKRTQLAILGLALLLPLEGKSVAPRLRDVVRAASKWPDGGVLVLRSDLTLDPATIRYLDGRGIAIETVTMQPAGLWEQRLLGTTGWRYIPPPRELPFVGVRLWHER